MRVEERVQCDRCRGPCIEGHYATLRSLEHVLKQLEPKWRVDLCAGCYRAFRDWLEESP